MSVLLQEMCRQLLSFQVFLLIFSAFPCFSLPAICCCFGGVLFVCLFPVSVFPRLIAALLFKLPSEYDAASTGDVSLESCTGL